MKKEALTHRYWLASLAWRNVGSYADGWTVGNFIDELRGINASDVGFVGLLADALLDDVVRDRGRHHYHDGVVIPLRPNNLVNIPIAAKG